LQRFEGSEETILQDAVWDAGFRSALFQHMAGQQRSSGRNGELVGMSGTALASGDTALQSTVLGVEQSNSSMVFEGKYFPEAVSASSRTA
jgi:hypothetical protein